MYWFIVLKTVTLCPLRAEHAAKNCAIVRKIALNLLKKDMGKESLRSKRLKLRGDNSSLKTHVKCS